MILLLTMVNPHLDFITAKLDGAQSEAEAAYRRIFDGVYPRHHLRLRRLHGSRRSSHRGAGAHDAGG